jgi:hypothetical protein
VVPGNLFPAIRPLSHEKHRTTHGHLKVWRETLGGGQEADSNRRLWVPAPLVPDQRNSANHLLSRVLTAQSILALLFTKPVSPWDSVLTLSRPHGRPVRGVWPRLFQHLFARAVREIPREGVRLGRT